MRRLTTSILALSFTLLTTTQLSAQEVIRKVENVVVKNLEGNAAKIPHWGEKNLMIFYIDPDRAGQNQEFTYELERSKRAEGENLVGMGIMNLKDAPFIPNGLARRMALKRTEKNGATVLSDEGNILSNEWKLGNCNNMFVVLMINRAGEIVFIKKGELSETDKEEFYEVIDLMK
ncbi:MAG: hypothetical protein SNG14_01735 [Rikenellaceae bacterium]